jgi:hypothetical protein
VLEGKVVNGYWESGRLNRILGRQLECGQEAWYVRSARNVGEFSEYAFRYFILGKKYNIEFVAEGNTVYDLYSHELTKRQVKNFEKVVERSYSGFNDSSEYADPTVKITKDVFEWR